jgi:hypothetical protein
VTRPLTFAYRNVVFAADARDPWAVYRIHTTSYAGLPVNEKLALLSRLAAFAAAVETDFQVLRVSRGWSAADYAASARQTLDAEHGRAADLDDLMAHHTAAIEVGATARPEVFLSIRLRPDDNRSGLADLIAGVLRTLGVTDSRGIGRAALEEVLALEQQALGTAADYLDVERIATSELQWLIRRMQCRGTGEPWLDQFWRPQALVLDADDEDGGVRFVPTDADLVALLDAPVTEHRDHLEIGRTFQAVLVAGALPEVVVFPGRQAELLFGPLEAVGFPVDAAFAARVIPNDRALALVRKRNVDADHALREEAHGDHGPTAQTAERPELARELEERLTSTSRPPLLRAQLSLAVGAESRAELDECVRLLRREFAPIALHRPRDVQLPLWVGHLPAQLPRLRRYDEVLLPEQFGAMVPTATHAVGSRTGLLIGHTLSGSRQPVLFDVTEGSRTSRPPAVLCTGTPGSGKTVTAQLLAYHAFVGGSQVVDLDPKGDHHLAEAIGEEHVEHVELTANGGFRGMLDPLRIAPEDLRVELAHSFLTELLPSPVLPQWQTEIRAAVSTVVAAGGRSCGLVLEALERSGDDARQAARAIEVHAGSGLMQLGFADHARDEFRLGERPVVSLRIDNLTLPSPGTPKADLTQEERSGRALLRLLAVQALHVASSDWSRHKVLIVEELSQLASDAIGLALIQRIVRMCRSQNTTPILVTQVVEDVAAVDDLVGCFFAFGVETDAEARRVLSLLGMDPEDTGLRGQLRSFRRGRCLLRDYEGRISPIQVDLADGALLRTLDTTPRRQDAVSASS